MTSQEDEAGKKVDFLTVKLHSSILFYHFILDREGIPQARLLMMRKMRDLFGRPLLPWALKQEKMYLAKDIIVFFPSLKTSPRYVKTTRSSLILWHPQFVVIIGERRRRKTGSRVW